MNANIGFDDGHDNSSVVVIISGFRYRHIPCSKLSNRQAENSGSSRLQCPVILQHLTTSTSGLRIETGAEKSQVDAEEKLTKILGDTVAFVTEDSLGVSGRFEQPRTSYRAYRSHAVRFWGGEGNSRS